MFEIQKKLVSTMLVAVLPLGVVALPAQAQVPYQPALNAPGPQVLQDFGPPPTKDQIDQIHQDLGKEAVAEIQRAQTEASNGDRAGAVIAGVAISALAWCASGALASLPESVLKDIMNRGDGGGDYISNAVWGCAGGIVGKVAWRLIPQSVKKKIYDAVVRFYWNHIRRP